MMAWLLATALRTFSFTVSPASSVGSWGRYPAVRPGSIHASPVKSLSMPAMMRSRVDLPDPLDPMIPILAP